MKKKEFVLSCILILVGIGICLLICNRIFYPPEMGSLNSQVDGFHALEDNSVDVIVYGSSHAWRGIDTGYMYDEYGINAYNYGCNWQKINTTDLFVNDSLLTQNPKLVIIDLSNIGLFLEDTDVVGEVLYTRNMKLTEAKKRYLNQCFGDDSAKYGAYYFPFSVFHSSWNTLTEDNFTPPKTSKEELIGRRGCMNPGSEVTQVSINNGSEFWEEEALPDKSLECLNDMVAVSKQDGARVMLITIPFFSGEFFYRDVLTEYAKANDCIYLDFFSLIDEVDLNGDTDFAEAEHLNESGATKLSKYLSEYIIDNQLLED